MRRKIKIQVVSVSLVILFIISISCASEEFDSRAKGNPMPAKAIDEVLREHARTIMSTPGVVGIGQGLCEGKPCIKVFVIKKTEELNQKIPSMLEGYPVAIEETGKIRALPEN
jgi:hypothetical protein